MPDDTTQWKQEAANLRHEISRIRLRLEALEAKPAEPISANESGGDYTDAFHHGLQGQLRREREKRNSEFTFGVAGAVSQVARNGSSGTAFGIVTFYHVNDLPDLETVARRRERALLFLENPLVLPVLHAFYKRFFAGERRATSEQLADLVQATPEQVDEALRPLVQNKTLSRGLSADNEPFYEWDGNTMVATALLFHD
jgi:hypothetical protein